MFNVAAGRIPICTVAQHPKGDNREVHTRALADHTLLYDDFEGNIAAV